MALNNQSVLIISNTAEVAHFMATVLATQGYYILNALSGKEGLSKVEMNVNLILIDKNLPDYNGLKLCHLLKMDKSSQHIPIIIFSHGDRVSEKIESFYAGADDYLTQPIDWDDLLNKVETSILRAQVASKIQEDANFELLDELHDIVDGQNVIPYFQPIYQLAPFKLYGMEALSRPQSQGLLSNPETLFKIAMRFGCYYELEMIVWKKALAIAQKAFGIEHLFLNCSPHLIEFKDAGMIKEVFSDFDMKSRHVYLEVTERSAISVYDNYLKQVSKFRQQGFKIAIDDVGAGYSSLDVIIQTKPEVVKIDRHIIYGLESDPFKRSLVRLIVEFCQENGIICIAEGIETKADLKVIMELGVELGQGYYFRRPSSIVDMHALRSIVLN